MNYVPPSRTIFLSIILLAFIAFTFHRRPFGERCSFSTMARNGSMAHAADDDGLIPNPPFPPFPDLDIEPNERLQSLNLGRSNTVMGWPSVGGIIAAEHVQSVELDFLGLDRFNAVNRTYNVTEEDEFCRRLRLVGGKWWSSYWDFIDATQNKGRKLTPEEEEILYLGWPKSGGAWILRLPDRNHFWYGFDRAKNAHTMEERCMALEMSGATFFENPEDCVYLKPLLDGFGEDKAPPPELVDPELEILNHFPQACSWMSLLFGA